jgi:hypothetical protein
MEWTVPMIGQAYSNAFWKRARVASFEDSNSTVFEDRQATKRQTTKVSVRCLMISRVLQQSTKGLIPGLTLNCLAHVAVFIWRFL